VREFQSSEDRGLQIATGAGHGQYFGSESPREVPISREVELKLAANAADLADLTQVLETRSRGRATGSQRLVSTYFDTPQGALRKAGTVLRVRTQEGGFVQSVKSAERDQTNLFAREEWEDAVAQNRPDPEATESGSHIPAELADTLSPVFVSDVERTAIEIEPELGTRVEAAVDRGVIRTADGTRSEPISEIELELKEGDPAALYDLALELLKAAPLRIDLRSKSERGYRLVEDVAEPSAATAPETFVLTPEMTLEDALQRVGCACLAHFLRSETAALAGTVEGVHQMRVAMRRLRSLLAALTQLLPEGERRWVSDEIKVLADGLGAARNLDVFATELLEPAREKAPDQPGWDVLGAAVGRARADAHRRVCEEIHSPRHTASVLRLLRWFESRGWRQAPGGETTPPLAAAVGTLAPPVLDRRRKKVRQRSRHFRRLSAHQRHRLRIAVKKLRYTIELLSSLYQGPETSLFVKRLKRVQDVLGHANDVRVAYGLVIQLGRSTSDVEPIADAGAQLLAHHQQELARREDKLRRQLRRLNKVPPFWCD
jgi:triphosphatase